MDAYLVELHHLFAIHALGLIEWRKVDLLWWQSFIAEGSFNRIQIVRTDSDKRAVPCKVCVQLVLQSDEAVISCLVELDATKHGAREVRSYPRGVVRDCDLLELAIRRRFQLPLWDLLTTKEDIEVHGNAFEAEHVIAVGWDFDLELGGFFHAIDDGSFLVRRVLIEFQAIVEAERIEFFSCVFFAQRLEKGGLVYANGRHAGVITTRTLCQCLLSRDCVI